MKRQVFYSFHYETDVMRVQQIRNMGVWEGKKPVAPNEWEKVKRQGEGTIRKWIDRQMKYRSCVVVLIGEKTSEQKWVNYEIKKALQLGKGLMGLYIHNLKCPRKGTCCKGKNPFENFMMKDGRCLSEVVPCYDPDPENTYQDIKHHLNTWIEEAIAKTKPQFRVPARKRTVPLHKVAA